MRLHSHAISKLRRDAKNANKGTKRGKKAIKHSLKEYGYGRSIVLDKQQRVIAGNKTLENALELGAKQVLVVTTNGEQLVAVQRTDLDLDHAKAKALAIADNRTSELNLDWDRENLKQLSSEVDLSPLFNTNELEKLIGRETLSDDIDASGLAALKHADELQQKWGTAAGQIWQVAGSQGSSHPHRISCADSSRLQDMERLMAGQRAQMTFTDPPWNVNIGGGDHSRRKRKCIQIANDNLPAAQFSEFLEKAISVIRAVADGDLYCVMACAEWPNLDRMLRDQGYHWSATIAWIKQVMVLTRRKYHARFEPIWYGWHQDRKSSFCAGRNQDDVWEFPRPMKSPDHPTMKPVDLVAKAIFNSSKPGDIVFEPFAGSGTTLLAAEHMNRVCYANELLPKYVAVALERLSLCGLQPERIIG